MKKLYANPELNEMVISVSDIIQTSAEEPAPLKLKTAVNGKEGADYGTVSVSLLD